jgi:hypothetical protein
LILSKEFIIRDFKIQILCETERRASMSNEICDPRRRDFLKGVVIGAGGFAFGSMLIHPKEAVAQSIEGNLEKVPMEARWDLISGAFIYNTVNYFKALYDQGGKEKLVEYMKERSRMLSPVQKGMADRFGLTGNDAKSAAVIISTLTNIYFGPKAKFEIEDATAEKARVKCINCTFWNAARAMKINDDICSAWSQYMWDGRAKAINPKLTATLVKARPLGDSVCEWAFELKA